jgi:hypothetical protein
MRRFAVFAMVGPPMAAATLFLILLPVAGVLEGVPIEISTPVLSVYSYAVLAALVVALFDGVAALIEVPFRPIAAAIVGWLLAFILLRAIWHCRICRGGLSPSVCWARSRALSARG